MAGSQQYTVGTAPTLLVSAPPIGGPTAGPVGWFSLANGTVTTVYLGGGTQVSTVNGYPLGTAPTSQNPNTLAGTLYAGDLIYGIVASGSAAVSVIQTGA